MVKSVHDSILNATETYTIVIRDCISANGLQRRMPGRNSIIIEADRPTPGTIEVVGPLIYFYAQYGVGDPFTYNNSLKQLSSEDTTEQRLIWFTHCLERLAQFDTNATFALPYKSGCGRAGGVWAKYKPLIFASAVASRITIYRVK